jgi:hypothetical protein
LAAITRRTRVMAPAAAGSAAQASSAPSLAQSQPSGPAATRVTTAATVAANSSPSNAAVCRSGYRRDSPYTAIGSAIRIGPQG